MSVIVFGSTSFNSNNNNNDTKEFITLTKNLLTKVNRSGDEMRGNLSMKGNKITDLGIPVNDLDAVNKGYLHEVIKNEQNEKSTLMYTLSDTGLVPHLTAPYDESGYSVFTSSFKNADLDGFKVFNPTRNTAWRVADGVNGNFWIELHCLEKVKVYKFTARTPVGTKLILWKMEGANDDGPGWEPIPFTPVRPIEDGITKTFKIDPNIAKYYQLYRLFIEKSEGDNPGLNYLQLYTVNHIIVT